MITDRFTARVLGALVLSLTFIITISCFVFSRPEVRANPRFAVVVLVAVLPLVVVGIWLFRKANSLKADED